MRADKSALVNATGTDRVQWGPIRGFSHLFTVAASAPAEFQNLWVQGWIYASSSDVNSEDLGVE